MMLLLLAGCTINHYLPRHFDFVTVVEKTEPGAGGWRAACLHVPVINSQGLSTFVCRFGVEMPIETEAEGYISETLAQRIAADCATEAGRIVLRAPSSPSPGLVCEQFKKKFNEILGRAVKGSRVMTECHERTTPTTITLNL
ncbi:hypothetical protein [Archangium lansingense]|uniref:Lipoprotein n=1 Tax=Archangium lansingense TaxID=2995310 RepID=A0ABT4AJA4_9BACT|nr:hypothetical protein [Archangium lansinium]MCY1081747.1 hypothetical protein [Archangium lansinium]